MGNQFNEIMQKLRAQRVRARRYTAMLLVLAMLTSLSVSWRLHQVGTALTTDSEYCCGMEEHVHTDDCYTEELVCGYEEGEPEDPDSAFSVDSEPTTEEPEVEPEEPEPEEIEPEVHHHTADCYETVLVEHEELTCGQEEHTHDETCPVDPDTGDFLCGFEEHTHTDDCYTTETETEEKLVCGYEEGQVISDGAADDDGIAALEDTNTATSVADDSSEAVSEPVLHHHTEACYEKVLTCTIPEHTHTLACLADYSADVETDDDWEKYSVGLSDKWNEALLAVAQEQLGYKESEKNFQTDEALGDIIDAHHYTRYGAFYGNPYADWDVAFIAFCQHYAGIPKTEIPQRLGLEALRADMDAMGFAYLTEGEDAAYEAIPGDVVTYNKNGTADDETIGIVETVGDDSLTVISGAVEGAVAEVTVPFTDVTSTILVDQAYGDYVGEADDRDGSHDDEIAVQPADEVGAVAVAASSGETQYPINLDDEEVARSLQANFTLQKKDSDGLYQPVTNGTTVNEGDDLQVMVSIKAPAGTFSKTKENGNKLKYTLPFKLKEPLVHKEIYDRNDKTKVIGYLDADTDGNVTVEFLNEVDTFDHENEFDADFKVWGKAVAKGTGENQTIKFPGDSESFTLKKKSDISVTKEVASDIIEEEGKTYFKYTITVNSKNGTAGETVDIRDQITSLYNLTGKFDKDSFELKKNGNDVVDLATHLKMTTDESGRPGFTMSALPPLEAGESYTLTYRYEITNADKLTAKDYGEVGNKAYAKYGNHDEKGTIEIKKGLYGDGLIITKTGGYSGNGKTDLAHGRIKWQVDIQNPSGKDLKGYVVTDTIRSGSDAVIREQNGVEVYVSQDGSNYSTYIVNNKAEKGTVTDEKKGFTYTFPDGSTGKNYRFIYYTTNPTLKAGETTTVENDVTAERGGEKYTGEGKVTVEAREGLLIKAPNGKTLDVVDSTKLKKDWSIAVRTAAEMDAGKTFTIKDTFQPPKVNESESATLKHYAIKSALDGQLKAGMNLYWVRGDQSNQESLSTVLNRFPGVSVTFKYYKEDGTEAQNDDDHVTSFEITVDWKNATTYPNLIITQLNADNYTSYIEDISSLKAGDTVKATNTIECKESKKEPTEATNSYTKPEPDKPKKPDLRKLVSDSVYNFGDKTATIRTDTPNGTVIWFKLLIKNPDPDADTVTITDTLPKGLKYVKATSDETTLNWKDSYRVGTTKYDSNGVDQFVEEWASTSKPVTSVFQLDSSKVDDNGRQVLTFTLSGLSGKDLTKGNASIIYGVKVEDDYWKDIRANPSKEYPNEAKWGDLEKSATATVTRTNFETKKGVNYDPKTQTATYTVTINEQSKQLLPYAGGYLKLEDKLTVPTGLSATLDPNSIVVKNGSGNIVKDALRDCNIYPDTHTMEIEIKDGAKYELSYTYKFVPHEGLPADQTLTVTNEVEMFGHIASNNETHFQNASGSGTASNGVTDILTLVKSEKGKNNNTLGGVTFELSEYGESGWTSKGNHTTASDDAAKGTITFRYNEHNDPPAGGTVSVKADTLYRLVETQPANDYILDKTPHYFVMLSQGATADEVYQQNLTGSGVAQSDIKFVSAGQMTDVLKVENEARKIKVEKVWKDADGKAMTAPKDSITVTLKRKLNVNGAVDDKFNETLTLTRGNGWKVTYPDEGSLPETDKSGNLYYYFVTETEDSVPDGFSVMYNYVDKNGVTQSEHGVTAGGTATITNQQKTNWLKVEKKWLAEDGKTALTDLPENTAITLKLYKVGDAEPVKTQTLKKGDGNNWKYTFTGLDPEKEYYVEEVSVDGYTVSYSSDVENPAVPGATITVTNRKNAPGYELPATGSTGTAPYTTAGAVLMGAALVGGYRRKRRQERRGE